MINEISYHDQLGVNLHRLQILSSLLDSKQDLMHPNARIQLLHDIDCLRTEMDIYRKKILTQFTEIKEKHENKIISRLEYMAVLFTLESVLVCPSASEVVHQDFKEIYREIKQHLKSNF